MPIEDSQVARIAIRKTVLAGLTVQRLISNRFYPAEPGIYKVRKYPCANFRISGGITDPDVKEFKKPDLVIWAHSEDSYDEAYKVYEAIFYALHNELLREDERGIVCKEDTRPMEAYEPASEVFYLRASWAIRMVNYG